MDKDMDKDLFINMVARNFATTLAIMTDKNQDYAVETDPFKNFRGCTDLQIPVEKGIMIRLLDKVERIKNLLSRPSFKPAVSDESVEDTLCDLMAYANILLTYMQWEEKKQAQQNSTLPGLKPDSISQ